MSDFIPHDIHQPHLICSFCSLEHPSHVIPLNSPLHLPPAVMPQLKTCIFLLLTQLRQLQGEGANEFPFCLQH